MGRRLTGSGSGTGNISEQFDLLIEEILRGDLRRVIFRPWEMELLVDIATCDASIAEIREYRIAAKHELKHNGTAPIKLSTYLARRGRNRADAVEPAARRSVTIDCV